MNVILVFSIDKNLCLMRSLIISYEKLTGYIFTLYPYRHTSQMSELFKSLYFSLYFSLYVESAPLCSMITFAILCCHMILCSFIRCFISGPSVVEPKPGERNLCKAETLQVLDALFSIAENSGSITRLPLPLHSVLGCIKRKGDFMTCQSLFTAAIHLYVFCTESDSLKENQPCSLSFLQVIAL